MPPFCSRNRIQTQIFIRVLLKSIISILQRVLQALIIDEHIPFRISKPHNKIYDISLVLTHKNEKWWQSYVRNCAFRLGLEFFSLKSQSKCAMPGSEPRPNNRRTYWIFQIERTGPIPGPRLKLRRLIRRSLAERNRWSYSPCNDSWSSAQQWYRWVIVLTSFIEQWNSDSKSGIQKGLSIYISTNRNESAS